MTQTADERKQKWLDFIDVHTGINTIVLVNYVGADEEPRPWPYPQNHQARIDWAVASYHRQMENTAWLDDDHIPVATPYTGTEIFAEAFGCKVHYSGDNMPFALPKIKSAAELSRIKQPSVHHSTLSNIFEIAAKIRQRVGMDAIFQLPDIQSPVDIAALVWEKADFLMTMVDDPQAIKEISAITEQLLTEFLDEWFKEFGTDYIAHYPQYMMRKGFTFSEDEIGEFSADMFVAYCLDPINRLSDRYGGCGMHCCADAYHQWEKFKLIHGLRLINLVLPSELLDQAGSFFEDKICHWHMARSSSSSDHSLIPSWAEKCSNQAHLVLEANATTRSEAIDLAKRLRAFEDSRRA